ncbi:Phosphodiest-domain-containing protein [Didymella exigua CBS 183.55]|uniref:Phosphodiest-domain-containing protein n=1 Tax=Didymella exigua CBS 183.55 TaxID=1150837 RepID=A0A6A5RXW5_9PLEO|nr:Phosphodiest-domain-containing protein [Didymella exigua CBS 183.55]KAF1932190.1 Phosphodiest-domain-containing protein [Didymella exigua CBS 183.55]
MPSKSRVDAGRAAGAPHYDNGSDSDDYDLRPSAEHSDDDHDLLESEDERERLLTQEEGTSGLFGSGVKIGKRDGGRKKAEMTERKRGVSTGASTPIYDTEEAAGESTSNLLRSERSSESDQQRLLATKALKKAKRSRRWRSICIYTSIIGFFFVLLAFVYRLSKPRDSKIAAFAATAASNGTSLFAPTTILISLDGFRADFLHRNLTPTLNDLVARGISPKYMLPSFPSVTFPNHYTMATGMYPEAHGIVGNTFWDPNLQKEFYYTDPERSLQPFWWGGEPFWVTAERQSVRTAVHMWPGSEAHIEDQQIAYVDKYNGSEVLDRKVDRIMDLLDVPGPMDIGAKASTPRPQLIAAYVPNVDGDGHRYGPNSTQIRQTISSADAMVGGILKGLQERNLTNIVNVVVVSDHGMATTDVSRMIQLENLIDPDELSHVDGWPLYGLRPKNRDRLYPLYDKLVHEHGDNPNIEIYLRENMPERYHFSNNDRIAPLWIIPKAGWAIVTKSEFNVEEGKKKGEIYHPRGLHGYDHEHPLMRAVFVARGPAFPHTPGSRMKPFQNIELYNIICDSVGLIPAPNNGTLRLPLKPVGLHNDDEDSADETPHDPVDTHSLTSAPPSAATMSATTSSLSSLAASASGLEATTASLEGSASVSASATSSAPPAASSKPVHKHWWDWFTDKADDIEEWVDDFVHKHNPLDEEDKEQQGS